MKKLLLLLLCVPLMFSCGDQSDDVNYKEMTDNGAIIIDVRSESEFKESSIENSINIPLDELNSSLNEIKDKNQVIITCCLSGKRSSKAKEILKSNGYKNVFNGDLLKDLEKKIKLKNYYYYYYVFL